MTKSKLDKLARRYDDFLIESLKDKEEAALYLQAALDVYQKDGDHRFLLMAFRNVVEAQGGIGKLAEATQLNRESLYRTLSNRGNPKLETFGILLNALGFHLSIKAA